MGTESKVTSCTPKSSTKLVTKAAAPAKAAPKKAVTAKAAAPRKPAGASAAAPATRPRSARKTQTQITAEDRMRYIEVAAYYLAERRGFSGGNPADDWVAAEQQVDSLLLGA